MGCEIPRIKIPRTRKMTRWVKSFLRDEDLSLKELSSGLRDPHKSQAGTHTFVTPALEVGTGEAIDR